jgi:hypothetical protein
LQKPFPERERGFRGRMRIRGGEEEKGLSGNRKRTGSVLQTCVRFLFLGRICRVQMGWTILAFETIL